jgi:hypothetical protein
MNVIRVLDIKIWTLIEFLAVLNWFFPYGASEAASMGMDKFTDYKV